MSKDNFQTLGTILAIAISLLALAVSVYEANLLKAQQRAMVWPHFTIAGSFSERGFSFVATNFGTGPAIIESVEVRFKDSLISNHDDLLDRINPQREIGYDRIRMSTLNQTVFKAGEERVVFNMPWDDETREMATYMRFVTIKVQYKSVLGERWIFDSETNDHVLGEFQSELEFMN
ncbi:MAG: hypothetical protein AAFP89_17810 [Bacteroidota bacterium]